MLHLESLISNYLEYCLYQKKLNPKTLKAYEIDLKQFQFHMNTTDMQLNRKNITPFLTSLHKTYQPKTVKRKIASIKAFCNYLVYEEYISETPFTKIQTKFSEPSILPKTIPLNAITGIFTQAYHMKKTASTKSQYNEILRNIAVLEMLFATGIRVSELCSLKVADIDLIDGTVKIWGKGSKERIVQISNPDVIASLILYNNAFQEPIGNTGYFFINRLQQQLSDQSVRFMIKKYAKLAGIQLHITPHMFRHSVATLLLEEDVDIRYIQQLLGHSSIVTTQIYTHVTSKKQRDILSLKHPRNKIFF